MLGILKVLKYNFSLFFWLKALHSNICQIKLCLFCTINNNKLYAAEEVVFLFFFVWSQQMKRSNVGDLSQHFLTEPLTTSQRPPPPVGAVASGKWQVAICEIKCLSCRCGCNIYLMLASSQPTCCVASVSIIFSKLSVYLASGRRTEWNFWVSH